MYSLKIIYSPDAVMLFSSSLSDRTFWRLTLERANSERPWYQFRLWFCAINYLLPFSPPPGLCIFLADLAVCWKNNVILPRFVKCSRVSASSWLHLTYEDVRSAKSLFWGRFFWNREFRVFVENGNTPRRKGWGHRKGWENMRDARERDEASWREFRVPECFGFAPRSPHTVQCQMNAKQAIWISDAHRFPGFPSL